MSNTRSQNYSIVLSKIALVRIIDSKSINLLFKTNVSRSRFIRKAIDQKHIRKIQIKERKHNDRKVDTYYQITGEGIRFLSGQETDIFEMISSQTSMALFSRSEARPEVRTRQADVSTAIILCHAAGAVVPPETFGSMAASEEDGTTIPTYETEIPTVSSADKPIYTLRNFYRDHLVEESALYQNTFAKDADEEEEDYIIFHDRGLVKETLAARSINHEIRDFFSGRYAGILDSNFKSAIVYITPRFTMPWTHWLIKAEINAYRLWKRTNALGAVQQQERSQETCIVVVDNAHDFAYHYLAKSRAKERREVFGGTYAHAYIVPNDKTGAIFLNWLMRTEDGDVIRDMTQFSIDAGEFFPNANQASPQFIIRDNHGIETAICMTFDVKQLNMILYYIKDIHDKLFQIICFDWQKDYLRRIMPSNVVYRTFPMSIIQ